MRPESIRLVLRHLAGALAAALLAGCDRAAVYPALVDAPLARLVPAHEFVFNRESLGGFSFSPDGSRLAWSAPSGWRSGLHVRAEGSGTVNVYRVGASAMYWSADSRRLLILDDKSGAENHHLFRLDIDDPAATPVDLTPYPGVRVWLHQILRSDPEHVLVLHNRRDRTLRDLYRIDLSTGAEELVSMNPGDGVSPLTDATGQFAGWRKPAMSGRLRGKPRPPELKERSALSHKSDEVTRPIGLSPDRSQAWLLSNRGRDRVALIALDARKGSAATLYEEAKVDVGQVVVSAAQGKPLLASSQAGYPRTVVFDPELDSDLKPLLAPYRGSHFGIDIVTMDPAEKRMVIAVYTHATRRYYLLERARKQYVLLGERRQKDFSDAMVMPQAVEFSARDGMTIPAYLFRPTAAAGKRLPLVLLVHGGPWSRVIWGDPDQSEDLLHAQFLANRGYAVLAVNFRGSTGYGRSFTAAGVGEFGAKMQDDLLDGLHWAIEAGIADPARIAIMGHSYGGYATLMAMAQHPRTFACGIDVAGPTDLAQLIESFPSYWELELNYWYSYVGDPAVSVDRERMLRVSPLNVADAIERPLLIVQGAKDVRVRPQQSSALAERLRRNGKRIEYVEVPDMGHSLGYWAHHLLVLRRSEAFLAECLGGRAARFDALEWVARLSGRLPLH